MQMYQPVAKKLVLATGAQEYNILQNNGRGAHQEVGHVSVSFGPRISGLGVRHGLIWHG
jgi:diadenosine tetraphosphate (Ap4A) HIT family hydrolase